jgi:hypothetical protein
MKWLVNQEQFAPAHILARDAVNAVNALLITEEAGKSPGASFQKPAKKHMTGQLKTCIEIIRSQGDIESP